MSGTLQQILIDGQPVWVEVADVEPAVGSGDQRFTRTATRGPGGGVNQMADVVTQADVAPLITAVAGPVRRSLEALSPQEITVEIAVGIKAGVGFFLANGEANASVKVTAKWKIDGKPAGG